MFGCFGLEHGAASNICQVRPLSLMDHKQRVIRALEKARKYRSFATWISDQETAERISELAKELNGRARALATRSEELTRRRAREIWEENGRPLGRDKEFWYRAERELREAEEIANSETDSI
jgi:hypothetical protein